MTFLSLKNYVRIVNSEESNVYFKINRNVNVILVDPEKMSVIFSNKKYSISTKVRAIINNNKNIYIYIQHTLEKAQK